MPGLGPPLSRYTDATRFCDFLFISGSTPFDPNGNLIGKNDPVAQTEHILKSRRPF